MNKEIDLFRANKILDRFLIVDGVARCGKSMLCPILASLKGVEIERLESIFENLTILYSLGKIDRDAAVSLLSFYADKFIYESYLSRNTNFRWKDHSSVFRNPDCIRYIKRLFREEGPETVEAIVKDKPIFQIMAHDQLGYVDIYFDMFAEAFRMIEVLRNPVDLVDSWMRRGWGVRFGEDARSTPICAKVGDKAVPYYAFGWEKDYLSMSPMDRIVKMLYIQKKKNREGYKNLSPERKVGVYIIKFEDFVTDPFTHIESIASFLGTLTTRYTPKALKAQRCPRKLLTDERNKKYQNIKLNCSKNIFPLIEEMISDYEGSWLC